MKRRGVLLIGLIACLFLFSGALGCGGGDKKEEAGGIFIGGIEGIGINFIPGKPDDLIYRDVGFEIGIGLKNNGEFDSKKIIVSLFGLNKDSFSLSSLDKQMISSELEGRDVNYPELDVDEEEIIFSAKYKEDIRADFKPLIKADVCYLYGGYSVADVCLKRDVFSKDEQDSCSVGDILLFESSSSPVQITDVEVRPAGKDELKMVFTVQNLGNGEVYLNDAFIDSCKSSSDKKNNVLINIDTTTIIPIECAKLSEQDFINLINGKRTISCKIDTSELQNVAFSERLNFNLYYFYKESLSKEIIIKP